MARIFALLKPPQNPLVIHWGEDVGVVDLDARELVAYGYDHISVFLQGHDEPPSIEALDYVTEDEEEGADWITLAELAADRYLKARSTHA